MLRLEKIIHNNGHAFRELAQSWHQATGADLCVLLRSGKLLRVRGETTAESTGLGDIDLNGLPLEEWGAYLSEQGLVWTPVLVNREPQGYLVSNTRVQTQQPLLDWAAKALSVHLADEEALEGMTDELIAAWAQLDLVYRITQTLGEQTDLFSVLRSVLDEVIKVLQVEAGFIVLNLEAGIRCVSGGSQQAMVDGDLHIWRPLFKLGSLKIYNDPTLLQSLWVHRAPPWQSMIVAPVSNASRIEVMVAMVNHRDHDFTAGDVKLVSAIADQIGAIIDNFRMHQELIAQERVQRELEIAAEIQDSLLSQTIPAVNNLDIDVSIAPAYEVGGDFYDFISVDEHHLTVVVGDVAGKGIPAAMFTSMIRTMLRMEAHYSQEPHRILQKANDLLHQDLSQAELFITAFVATFDTKNRALMFANAGHVPGIIYHAQSQTSRLLKATTLPIGVLRKTFKPTQYVHITDGDMLVLYSDGVSEAKNNRDEVFGIDRIQQLIQDHADQGPMQLRQTILSALSQFVGEEPHHDDVTLLVIKFALAQKPVLNLSQQPVLDEQHFCYPADVAYLMDIAAMVTEACRSLQDLPSDGKGDDFVYLVELAVSEICTNTIEHAYANQQGEVRGVIRVMPIGIQIDIYDQGCGFDPKAVPPPLSDPMDPTEGGYGLHIVRQIMDIAEYEASATEGNHWRLVKFLPDVSSP